MKISEMMKIKFHFVLLWDVVFWTNFSQVSKTVLMEVRNDLLLKAYFKFLDLSSAHDTVDHSFPLDYSEKYIDTRDISLDLFKSELSQ